MEVKTVIPSTRASIMLVGESPGDAEAACGKPFVGNDGKTLRQILTQAGIYYGDCIIANCSTFKLPKLFLDKKLEIPSDEFKTQIERLKQEIIDLDPNVIVPLGTIPLKVITGEKGINNFRGTIMESSLVPGKKVIPTLHPKAVTWTWKLFYQEVMDFRKILHESLTPDIPVDKRELVVAPTKQEALDYLRELNSKKDPVVAIDLEHVTPGAHISWFGISHDPNFAMSINFIQNRTPCFPETDEVQIWSEIAKLLSGPTKQVYHNAGYDAANLLHNQGVTCRNIHFDTLLAAHTLWPEFPKDLGFLSSILLSVPAWKHTGGKQYEHGAYNAADAANTRSLYEKLYPLIYNDEYFTKTFELEMAELLPAAFMQLQGIPIDKKQQQKLLDEFTEKMRVIEDGLSKILDKPINFKSPKQMQDLLYVDMGLPIQYKRRKSAREPRRITTDAEALEKLYIEHKDPVLKLILEHRKYSKILQFINIETSPEGKIHTSYNIGGTTTGRWSSSKSIILDYGSGNLQNIDHRVRTMYVPPEGYTLLQADYKGAEAHVVAHLIQDHKIIQCFDEGGDVHRRTAAFMFNKEEDEITPGERKVGKMVRHATNYSAGPKVLASGLKIPLREAKEYLSRFHNTTPQLNIWHESIKEKLGKNRTLITPLGRKRMFMERWGDQLFRSAYAFIPQSTIGDLLNISLCDFYQKHHNAEDVSLALQLHDAIYIWCKESELQKWGRELYNSMTRPIPLPHIDLYIGVDFKYGPNWGDMKEVEINVA